MSVNRFILLRIVCIWCTVVALSSCTDRSKPLNKTEVVRQKISQPKDQPPPTADSGQRQVPKKVKSEQVLAGQKTDVAFKPSIGNGRRIPQLAAVDIYNPKGKTDPFVALVKERKASEKPTAAKPDKKRKRVPRTPLERIELSQLKLAGVIHSVKGGKALVEEASGKGYIIGVGTFIGTRAGKVSDILKDRVVVEEEEEDALGKIQMTKRELRLQKPSGE